MINLLFRTIISVFLCLAFCTVGYAQTQYSKPIVYLTFDDGPSVDSVTDEVLDVLAMHNAKATFFVTGLRAKANPEKIQRIVDAGHAIGNHTVNHGRLTDLFDHQVASELSLTNLYVLEAGGPVLNCFRAPFGLSNARVVGIANSMGLRRVGWTIDTRDWDVFVRADHMATQLDDVTNQSIVLMHDGPQARWRTLSAFKRWMEEAGDLYSFQPIPACVNPMFTNMPVNLAARQVPARPLSGGSASTLAEVTLETPMVSWTVAAAGGSIVDRPVVTVREASRPQPVVKVRETQRPDPVAVKAAIQPVKKAIGQTLAAVTPAVESKVQTIRGLLEKLRNYEIELQN